MFRVKQLIQDKARVADNGPVLVKNRNAVLDQLLSSLRANREAIVCGVVPLGKEQPFPARHALHPTTSRFAEHVNIALEGYRERQA